MKKIRQLNEDIVKATTNLNEQFPELSKFVNEIPVAVPNENSPEIDIDALSDYKESLESLLIKYEKSHIKQQTTSPKNQE